jgi:hypothetical protein
MTSSVGLEACYSINVHRVILNTGFKHDDNQNADISSKNLPEVNPAPPYFTVI